jgi:hypothetical protein
LDSKISRIEEQLIDKDNAIALDYIISLPRAQLYNDQMEKLNYRNKVTV